MTDPQGTARAVSQSRTIATTSCDAALPRLPQGVGDGVERAPTRHSLSGHHCWFMLGPACGATPSASTSARRATRRSCGGK
jgi:hypothetical protein